MQLRDLEDLKKIFKEIPAKIAGVGITAFSRVSLAYFVEGYKIFCLKNTLDLPILRELANITCLGEIDESVNYTEPTSMDILSSKRVQQELFDSNIKYLYVYQSYQSMEMFLRDKNILPIANIASLREGIASKAFFIKLLDDLKIRQLDYEIITLNELLHKKYIYFLNRFKGPFVVQSLQIKKGGGRGVFFVETEREFSNLKEIISKGRLHNTRLEEFLLRPYVKSIPMSMLGCVTPSGVIAGPLQFQIIDLYGPTNIGERGIFCGHSWDENIENPLVEEARRLLKKIGHALKGMGYKGIYGIDFIWDKKNLYPLELNPRLTGALPVLTLLQLEKKVVALELLHILSFIEPYVKYDLPTLEDSLIKGVKGAQILIFYDIPKSNANLNLRAGKYLWDGSKAIYLSASKGFMPKGEREFSVMDGPLTMTYTSKNQANSFLRMARILFKNPVLDDNGNLLNWVRHLLKWIKGENFGQDKRTLSSDYHNTTCLQQGSR